MMYFLRRIIFTAIIFGLLIFSSGCKDEEVPKSTIGFELINNLGQLEVKESNGQASSLHPTLQTGATGLTYEVKLLLDRPVVGTTVVRFSTAGKATRGDGSALSDYSIDLHDNLLTINKGEQTASIWVTVYEDFELEYFELNNIAYLVEAFTITLNEVVSGPGIIGDDKTFSVFILEDDPLVFLSWDPQDEPGDDPGDVDMDLFAWFNGEIIGASTSNGISSEAVSFPAGLSDGQYGFSYTYYSGSSDDLEFYVDILNPGGIINGLENTMSFTATYTAANMNKYDDGGTSPFIAQTMDKVGLNYINLTEITINANGSRLIQNGSITKGMGAKLPIKPIHPDLISRLRDSWINTNY